MTPETTERDLIEEVEELLDGFPEIQDAANNIEHALFADAIERQRNSPFWGHSKKIARLYAASPELLRRLVAEVKRLRLKVDAITGSRIRDLVEDDHDD